jgi:lipoate-protein ligase A
MMPARVLPHETADGITNMALDEALLELAEAGIAVVRTYEWSEPTLSLGYFQSLSVAEQDGRWRGAPIVRRPTGGGALWHHHEVTYALVIPHDHPLARRHTDLYEAVHLAIAEGLRMLGVPARPRGDGQNLSHRPFLCFQDREASDVVVGPVKVVGSAQRRRAGAVLQHGALLLAHSPTTPELLGLKELVRDIPPGEDWSDWLLGRVVEACGLRPTASAPNGAERDRARALTAKYADPSWTARR